MYLLYLIALVPVFIGFLLFLFTKRVAWVEWILGSVLSFIIAGIIHVSAVHHMIKDTETWSGELVEGTFHPQWVEQYHVTHYTYDSKGNVTGSYTTTHYTTHNEYWSTSSNIDTEYNIEKGEWENIVAKFGGKIETSQPYKSGFYSGDKNIYTGYNHTGYIFPVTKLMSFNNRVKASPTLFSFVKPSPEIDKRLQEYPQNSNHFESDRLMGTGRNSMDLRAFDVMNAKVGFNKHANIIMVGFLNEDATIAEWQKSKWAGGKKNDVVICYGVKSNPYKAEWCRVFGWTEKEDCKRNLQNIIMASTLDNTVLDKIRDEVSRNYVIKEWKKFDYITIEPTTGVIIWMLCATFFTQVGFYIFAMVNNVSNWKELMDWYETEVMHRGYRYY